MQPFSRLQLRLLALLVVVVVIALGTVAVVAGVSATTEFERYVRVNRLEMQSVAEQIAASTGDRLVVTSGGGRVIVDSSGQLVGQALSPDQTLQMGLVPPVSPPGDPLLASADVLVWTQTAPPPQALPGLPVALKSVVGGLPPIPVDDREQVFVNAVTRSLGCAVLVGGAAAVVLAVAFARGILQPIGELTRAAQRMQQGDLTQRVEVRSRDEIGQLAQAFNAMADGLAQTEQLRRTMVADVAHELRTPLTNLRGYLEALRDGVAEPRRETIESLHEESVLLSHLVDDLQELSLSEAGGLTLRREPSDVGGLLRAAAAAVQSRARERGVQVELAPLPALPLVEVDPRRVGQVLRNLLVNALTYTAAGGRVRLTAAERNSDLVNIEVSDTGCGIDPKHLPNVFERFYRADPSRARATGGAGIGLALVKQLVTAHGGTVGVVSTPGQGSRFSFTVPVAACGPADIRRGRGPSAAASPAGHLRPWPAAWPR